MLVLAIMAQLLLPLLRLFVSFGCSDSRHGKMENIYKIEKFPQFNVNASTYETFEPGCQEQYTDSSRIYRKANKSISGVRQELQISCKTSSFSSHTV